MCKGLPFRVCVYQSEDEQGYYVAHCLEMDVIGVGTSVEEAMCELLECIDTQMDVCQEQGLNFLRAVPAEISRRYMQAKEQGQRICEELMNRIIRQANKRLGHDSEEIIDEVRCTAEIPPELCQLAS